MGILEESGDPDKAWKTITGHLDFLLLRQPLDRRICNYARARDFLAILGTFAGVAFLPSARAPGVPDPWPSYWRAGNFWSDLALTVNKIFTHQIPHDSINLTEKWMKQFLDIAVSDPYNVSSSQLN